MFPLRFLVVLGLLAGPSVAAAQDRPAVDRDKLQTDLRELERYFIMDLRTSFWSEPSMHAPKIPEVVQRVKQLRRGDELRREAIALAMRHARVGDMVEGTNPAPSHVNQLHNRLYFAWTVLLESEVLRPGMPLQEAVQYLGEPTPLENGDVGWFYNSTIIYMTHPALLATVRDGRVQEFRHQRS
jgi:hypothetical protein